MVPIQISLILNVEMLDFWTLGHRVNMDPGRLNGAFCILHGAGSKLVSIDQQSVVSSK